MEVLSTFQFGTFGDPGDGGGVKHEVVGCSMVEIGKNVANFPKIPPFLPENCAPARCACAAHKGPQRCRLGLFFLCVHDFCGQV